MKRSPGATETRAKSDLATFAIVAALHLVIGGAHQCANGVVSGVIQDDTSATTRMTLGQAGEVRAVGIAGGSKETASLAQLPHAVLECAT